MWYQSIFALALALPTSLAMQLLSSTSTTQTLICSTEYASTSLLGAVPTTTLNQTIEKEPQLLHTTVIPTEFVTPKPFSTRITLLETLTVNVTTTPSNGTWTTNSTVFDVSTCMLLPLALYRVLGANLISLVSFNGDTHDH